MSILGFLYESINITRLDDEIQKIEYPFVNYNRACIIEVEI